MFHMITKDDCRYCKLAKSALTARGLEYTEETLTPSALATMKASGLETVPQIWAKDESGPLPVMRHIGGFTDLVPYLEANFPE